MMSLSLLAGRTVVYCISRSYGMVCAFVQEENPRALTSGISLLQTHKLYKNLRVAPACSCTLCIVIYLMLNIGISIKVAIIISIINRSNHIKLMYNIL